MQSLNIYQITLHIPSFYRNVHLALSMWNKGKLNARRIKRTINQPHSMKKPPIDTQPLLNDLQSTDWKIRSNAAQMLGGARDLKAVEPLIHALSTDTSWTVRTRAATALGRLKDARTVEALVCAMKAGNWQLLKHAFSNVVKFGDKAVPVLAAYANNREETTSFRGACIDALGAINSPATIPVLLPLLDDPDIMVRIQAIGALGQTKNEEVFQALLRGLENIAPFKILEGTHDFGYKPAIQQALVQALSDWDDERVIAPFVALLGSKEAFGPDTDTLTGVTNALRKMSGVSGKMFHEIEAALDGATPTGRIAVALSLVWLRDRRGLETLAALRDDEDAGVRAAARWAYGQLETILGYGVPMFPMMAEFMLR